MSYFLSLLFVYYVFNIFTQGVVADIPHLWHVYTGAAAEPIEVNTLNTLN